MPLVPMPHPYTVDRQAKLVKRHVVSQVGVASSVASDVAIELISSGMLLGYQAIPHSSSHILKCSSPLSLLRLLLPECRILSHTLLHLRDLSENSPALLSPTLKPAFIDMRNSNLVHLPDPPIRLWWHYRHPVPCRLHQARDPPISLLK
jgi:hypothetical protein